MSDPAEAHGSLATQRAEVAHEPCRPVETALVFAAHVERAREREECSTAARRAPLAGDHEALQGPKDRELRGVNRGEGCCVQDFSRVVGSNCTK